MAEATQSLAQYNELQDAGLAIVGNFFQDYETARDGGFSSLIGMETSSDSSSEDYAFSGHAPSPRLWQGGRLARNPKKYKFSIKNAPYESSMVIPRSDLRRDKTGTLQRAVREMAIKAGSDHWDKLISAEIEANNNSYDSQAMFSVTHDESGSNQLNLLAAAQIPAANVSVVTAPTADEMAKIITQTIGYMWGIVDDQGDPVNGGATSWVIMAGGTYAAAIWGAIQKAISADSLSSGETNQVPSLGLNLTPVLNPRLTSTSDAFVYFFNHDRTLRPYVRQEEVGWTSEFLGEGTSSAFNSDAYTFGIHGSRAVGPGEWKYAARVTLS